MERHDQIVEDIADRIRTFYKLEQPYRISHGSSSSTRPRHSPDAKTIDIGILSQVISVDTNKKTCLVEPNVPMDRLVEATIPYGLIPPVVMEFPGITAGGGFSGTSGESSSFRHGFFNETVNFVEMILGNGDVVKASPGERGDLFHGAAGAAGTLGVTTLLEVRLVEAQRFFRWLLDDYSHTRTLYHALHASRISDQFVVQDLALPYDTAEEFISWVDSELGIWPLWLCPLKETRMPTFHPVAAKGAEGSEISQPMLNIGVWGWGPSNPEEFKTKNRALEEKLAEFGGRKWLYAHTHYTEKQFWELYDRSWYERLRERYFATTLPTVYDKVKHVEMEPEEKSMEEGWSLRALLHRWPIGGLYGMVLAFYSGDISLHRSATWKYKKE
ncbi:hypothetical protein NW752_010227 [Fusarium irregulare]|nr:hypothetical protein NW752_010227 [Fusarium irregulare]